MNYQLLFLGKIRTRGPMVLLVSNKKILKWFAYVKTSDLSVKKVKVNPRL